MDMRSLINTLILTSFFAMPVSALAAKPLVVRDNAQAVFISTRIYEILQAGEDVPPVVCTAQGCFAFPR